MNICKYRRCSEAEMKCHRLRAFHANLLEISVWESSDEKHLSKVSALSWMFVYQIEYT